MVTANKRLEPGFLAGVIEGFYGPPWSEDERRWLFALMPALGFNTYLYAPKDDLKHRTTWREPYDASEAEAMRRLIGDCTGLGVSFVYGISPGLSIRYSSETDRSYLQARLAQMASLGCRHFALLFDDIPDAMEPGDLTRWGSLAAAQAHVANGVFRDLRTKDPEANLFFCPTPYCGRMAERGLGGVGYLESLGSSLAQEIHVFWTGPEIISEQIEPDNLSEVNAALGRKVTIWDNLHANDYDGRRFFCGPYDGRPPELRSYTRGIFLNPNCEFPLNHVSFHTFGQWLAETGKWGSRASYLRAIKAWAPHFDVLGTQLTEEDMVLFGDCYYLPHRLGDKAAGLYAEVRALLATPVSEWNEQDAREVRERAAGLQRTCAALSDLRDRKLFYALHRRTWELREELDLLVRFIDAGLADPAAQCKSDFHLPGTYRGGIAAMLQRLLDQHADGTFTAREPIEAHHE